MTQITERHYERVKCPECGAVTSVTVQEIYDSLEDGIDDNLMLDSYQECGKCHHQFTNVDLSI